MTYYRSVLSFIPPDPIFIELISFVKYFSAIFLYIDLDFDI